MILFFILANILPLAAASEKEACHKLDNHLIIHDYATAEKEARALVDLYPECLMVQEVAIKAFSRAGNEEEALKAFDKWKDLSPTPPPRRIYEELAWGIICKGEKSASPLVRMVATVAAFWGQDARGVKVIERRLFDKNSIVRSAAVETASKLPDECLKTAILIRLNEETEWEVRLGILEGIGRMKITSMKPRLIEIIGDNRSTLEEKGAATESLLALLETIPRDELCGLARSNRAPLRALAAEIITCLHIDESVDLLWQMLNDSHAEVRAQAAMGLGVLRQKSNSTLENLLNDREFHVALAAAYTIILDKSHAADGWVEKQLQSLNLDHARLTAAMLGAAGKYGEPLAKNLRSVPEDFYVRMNLALAIMDAPALDLIYQGVMDNKERWGRGRKGIFHPLEPSKEKHKPMAPNWPEMVNKQTRIEILNLLAIKEHPKALFAVRNFLKDRGWGLAGMSSSLLLTEGDEGSPELVRELLKDSDPDIRLQAALILSKWDPSEEMGPILTQNYETLSREKKEIVLQAMGEIGDKDALDFLIGEMASPHATMRLIASASLLKSLYD